MILLKHCLGLTCLFSIMQKQYRYKQTQNQVSELRSIDLTSDNMSQPTEFNTQSSDVA